MPWKTESTTYSGHMPAEGNAAGPRLVFVDLASAENNRVLMPARSQKIRNHSPDGFAWGYEGSGPAQLALAILADFTNDETLAARLYQEFKRHFIARLPVDGEWILTGEQIAHWLRRTAIADAREWGMMTGDQLPFPAPSALLPGAEKPRRKGSK
jgi:hypothetical protein